MITTSHNTGLALFGKARRNILALLFGHADRAYYLNEIVKSAATGVSQVQLELKRLTEAGLLLREKRANQVYFRANPHAPIFADLKNIVIKTFGVAGVIREALQPLATGIDIAFIYGSIASGEETAASDLELLIIGSAKFAEIVEAMRRPQRTLGREINATIFPCDDFAARLRGDDHFLDDVLQNPRIFLIGEERELSRLAEKRLSKSAQTRRAGVENLFALADRNLADSNLPEHHAVTAQSLEFSAALEPNPIHRLDAFRRKRNRTAYETAGAASEQEVKALLNLTETLRKSVEEWLQKKTPLWLDRQKTSES